MSFSQTAIYTDNNQDRHFFKESSINDVTALEVKGFVTTVLGLSLITKSMTVRSGVKNCQKLRDVIYGWALTSYELNP